VSLNLNLNTIGASEFVQRTKHFSNLFSMPNQNLNQLLALGWNRDADTQIHFDSIKLFSGQVNT
jgi:hypothetical protein